MYRRFAGSVFAASIAAALLVSAPAFAKKHEAAAAGNPNDPVVAIVNGDVIHKSDVEAALRQIMPPGKPLPPLTDPQVFEKVRNDLILNKLAYQEAEKEGLQNAADVKHAEMLAHQQILTSAFFNKVATPAVTEDKVKAAYDEAIKNQPKQDEIHVRQILVKTEPEAQDIIKQLDAGGDFEKIAKEKGTAPDGGDLGYITKSSNMDPAFTDAAFALQPNTYTKTPVKTSFGYHVIQVLDKRPAKVPTLDEAKPQLRSQIAQHAVQERVNELVKSSKVQFFNIDGSPQVAPTTAAPPAQPVAPAPAAGQPTAVTPVAPASPLKLPGSEPTP